jgi:hypothetical protein
MAHINHMRISNKRQVKLRNGKVLNFIKNS